MTDEHVLEIGGREVARYRTDTTGIDPTWGPRPHLHPVRTLGGVAVTDFAPADHRWHLGFSVAVADVDGTNFWGGGTYRSPDGYQYRGDHGRIEHRSWTDRSPSHLEHELGWVGHTGETVLVEHRRIAAAPSPGGWTLTQTSELRNSTDRTITLGSPGTAGRSGAGYGGFFWRLPPGTPEVTGPGLAGEDALNGAVTPWIALRTPRFTLVLRSADGDPWFVRAAGYPGVGTAFAWDTRLALAPGESLRRKIEATITDEG
ncbi:PmoA family protein [Pseudonocardia sp. TRM90224]|uniref:DUF6807 domain-containing protein n=1 Tax=Pseudonocardia sp. TRM90224 TaxID=2812678 RepID=UPI001E2E7D31|nr:PmoA family protein [Pseudonocardia sp. TRM90224]